MIPPTTKYDPRIPNLQGVIRRNLKLLYSDPNRKTLSPKKDLVVGYSRAKNLKEILVPTRLPILGHRDDNSFHGAVSNARQKLAIFVRII